MVTTWLYLVCYCLSLSWRGGSGYGGFVPIGRMEFLPTAEGGRLYLEMVEGKMSSARIP